MLAKRTGMAMIAGLVLGGAGIVGAPPAEAASGCYTGWERVRSYPTGAPNVSVYINDVYKVYGKNCGSNGQMRVDVARAVDKCLGTVGAGKRFSKEITVTYQDKLPWNAAPPKPRGIKAGC